MDDLILSKFKNSVGKRLKFKVSCFVGTNFQKLEDTFYATLLSVNNEYLVVEQVSFNIDQDDKVTINKTERTLHFNKFELDNEIPLNH